MFRILKPIELAGWREHPVYMPLGQHGKLRSYPEPRFGALKWYDYICPACMHSLRLVAAIAGDDATVRIGCCEACGYVGYADRPSAQWFTDFYASGWNPHERQQAEAFVQMVRQEGWKPKPHPISHLARVVPFSPDTRVLDVGCGRGDALVHMREQGYRHLLGVEACPHRAMMAREAFGLDVTYEPLESMTGSYGVILSHHVLEHTYDPASHLKHIASLQPEGGYLVLGLPNFAGEPTMGVLMFLPHLHSFTREALRRLLGAAGYVVVEDHSDEANLSVVARKVLCSVPVVPQSDCFWAAEHKLRRGLGRLSTIVNNLSWNISEDNGTFAELPNDRQGRPPRQLHVEPIAERRTDAPIEIQWEGPCRLFVK